MFEPKPNPDRITSQHFTLIRQVDAFGEAWSPRERSYLRVRLLQTVNPWTEQHFFDPGGTYQYDNQHNLIALMEMAYQRGRADQLHDVQSALGIIK